MVDRRTFLKRTVGVVTVLGAAAFVPISVPEWLPEEPLLDVHKAEEVITKNLLARQEELLARSFFCTTTTDNNPIDDIKLGMKKIQEATGVSPNTLIIGDKQWDFLVKPESATTGYFFSGCVT